MAMTLRRQVTAGIAVLTAALGWMVTAPAAGAPTRSPAAVVDPALRAAHGTVGVIVTGTHSAERAVIKAGGSVTRELPIIGCFAAKVPANGLRTVARVPGV